MAARHSRRKRLLSRLVAESSLIASARDADEASANRSHPPRSTSGSSEHQRREFSGALFLDEILGRFSDALALIEAAHGALDKAQEDESPIAAGMLTLDRGIDELKDVYTEFDLTLVRLRTRGGGVS